jgi:arginine decarboxylase
MSLLSPVDQARSEPMPPQERLTIRVSTGVGEGRTRLSAFDAALVSAGVANFNLVRLSSVIPPGADVLTIGGPQLMAGVHGDRLYCVYAEAYASTPQEQAWAGVAWSRRKDGSGEGLFVEHGGASEATVTHDLRMSLADLSHRRGSDFVEAGSVTTSIECVDHPVCALVIATYYSAPWSRHDC